MFSAMCRIEGSQLAGFNNNKDSWGTGAFKILVLPKKGASLAQTQFFGLWEGRGHQHLFPQCLKSHLINDLSQSNTTTPTALASCGMQEGAGVLCRCQLSLRCDQGCLHLGVCVCVCGVCVVCGVR